MDAARTGKHRRWQNSSVLAPAVAPFLSEYVICGGVIASPPSRGYSAPLETASWEPYTVESARVGSEEKEHHQVNFQHPSTNANNRPQASYLYSPRLLNEKKLLKSWVPRCAAQVVRNQSYTSAFAIQWNVALAYDTNQWDVALCKGPLQTCGRTHRSVGCDNSRDVTHAWTHAASAGRRPRDAARPHSRGYALCVDT